MDNQSFPSVLHKAIAHYGAGLQVDTCIEEMSELAKAMADLTKAIIKHRRYPDDPQRIEDIREEMADVQIMLNQMKIIFGDVSEIEQEKMDRMERRMEADHDK